jgi:polyferredoxin
MQASVADKTTMRVRFAKERSSDCIACDACTDICYVDIEPRKMVQADPGCMNCGLCVEACHQVLEPLGVKSMLDFTIEKDLTHNNLNNKAVVIMGSSLILFIFLFFSMFFTLAPVELIVTRDDSYVSVIGKDGTLASKYFVQVMNQTAIPQNIGFSIEGLPPEDYMFEKNFIVLESGVKQKLQFAVKAKKTELKPGIQKFNVIVYNQADKKVLNKIRSSIFVPQ